MNLPLHVTTARQVSVCLVSKTAAADQKKILDSEAKPFVPGHLKHLFDAAPKSWISVERPLTLLLGQGWVHNIQQYAMNVVS